MKPVVDQDTCTGCALCTEICPEVFEMGDDGIAKVINPNPGDDLEDKIKEAEESCPVSAISTS